MTRSPGSRPDEVGRSIARWTGVLALGMAGCLDATGPESDAEVLGRFTLIALGQEHACAANVGGEVFCWGRNDRGQLSAGPPGVYPMPALSQIGAGAVDVTVGLGYSCFRTLDGTATCWGDGRMGQLGWGEQFSSPVGVTVVGGPWESISAGGYHSCGLGSSGVRCWGADRYGASLGAMLNARSVCSNPDGLDFWPCALAPVALDHTRSFVEVSAGLWHTCGREAAGDVYCWGVNTNGQLGADVDGECIREDAVHGDAHFPCAWAPVRVPLPEAARLVRAGGAHSCAIGESGSLYCWGTDTPLYTGQLGHGGAEGSQVPVRVASAETFTRVAVSRATIFASTCALTDGGAAYCWGASRTGALGAPAPGTCTVGGGAPCAHEPVAVDTEERFVDIAVGDEFACGVTDGARILCWGENDVGQLGDGTFESRWEPKPITGFGW